MIINLLNSYYTHTLKSGGIIYCSVLKRYFHHNIFPRDLLLIFCVLNLTLWSHIVLYQIYICTTHNSCLLTSVFLTSWSFKCETFSLIYLSKSLQPQLGALYCTYLFYPCTTPTTYT